MHVDGHDDRDLVALVGVEAGVDGGERLLFVLERGGRARRGRARARGGRTRAAAAAWRLGALGGNLARLAAGLAAHAHDPVVAQFEAAQAEVAQ
eukprot:2485184-Pleurochrysis_carterae.AAC.1